MAWKARRENMEEVVDRKPEITRHALNLNPSVMAEYPCALSRRWLPSLAFDKQECGR